MMKVLAIFMYMLPSCSLFALGGFALKFGHEGICIACALLGFLSIPTVTIKD